jgi:hypothetical protein
LGLSRITLDWSASHYARSCSVCVKLLDETSDRGREIEQSECGCAVKSGRVGYVPVIVRIGIEDDQVVREFARDVSIVPAAFFAPKFTPWHPAMQGKTLTSSSIVVSMIVIVQDAFGF